MTRDLKIIGDKIEFMGWHIADIKDVPATIRDRFVHLVEHGKPMPPYTTAYQARNR